MPCENASMSLGRAPLGAAASLAAIAIASTLLGCVHVRGAPASPPSRAGEPYVELPASASVGALAIDDEAIYWVDPQRALVMRMHKDGNDRVVLFDVAAASLDRVLVEVPIDLTLDGDYVFVTTNRRPSESDRERGIDVGGRIVRVGKRGGPAIVLADDPELYPFGIASFGAFVYWTARGGAGAVERASKSGGSVAVLAAGQPHPGSIAVDDTSIFWGNDADVGAGDGALKRIPIGGGGALTRAASQPGAIGRIVLDAGSVYWTNDRGAMAVPKAGGSVVPIALGAASIAVDGDAIYWARLGEGGLVDAIMMRSRTDATSTAIASWGEAMTTDLFVDRGAVFFGELGSVVRMPR